MGSWSNQKNMDVLKNIRCRTSLIFVTCSVDYIWFRRVLPWPLETAWLRDSWPIMHCRVPGKQKAAARRVRRRRFIAVGCRHRQGRDAPTSALRQSCMWSDVSGNTEGIRGSAGRTGRWAPRGRGWDSSGSCQEVCSVIRKQETCFSHQPQKLMIMSRRLLPKDVTGHWSNENVSGVKKYQLLPAQGSGLSGQGFLLRTQTGLNSQWGQTASRYV